MGRQPFRGARRPLPLAWGGPLGVPPAGGTCLHGANLEGADLRACNLRACNLHDCRPNGASLASAQLEGSLLGENQLAAGLPDPPSARQQDLAANAGHQAGWAIS